MQIEPTEEDSHTEDKANRNKSLIKKLPISSTPIKPLQKIQSPEKLYIIIGGYEDLKEALKKRGWVENLNPQSIFFDFKWTLKIKDIEYTKLKDHQIVNHFEKNGCLTSKVGLCRNLKNLIGSEQTDIYEFYPRCYDLEDSNEFEDFIEEFKFTKAEGIIKEMLLRLKGSSLERNKELLLKTAMAAIGRKIMDVGEKILCIVRKWFFSLLFRHL